MSNIVNPIFKETFYKGQDSVNQGVLIPLFVAPDVILKQFSKAAQKHISNYQKKGTVTVEPLLERHLAPLRELWFDKEDPDFARTMTPDIRGFACYQRGLLVGGVIWQESGDNLFLHQLIASPLGKQLAVPTIMIWESVKHFSSITSANKYKNLDVGASYNPDRQRFFENFACVRYPIILKPPFYPPLIRMTPFTAYEKFKVAKLDKENPTNKKTFFPRASYGLYAILKSHNIQPEQDVTIVKTFGDSDYISSCITKQIERVCKWHLYKEGEQITNVLLVVHEFGVPTALTESNLQDIKNAYPNTIVIEDCAWRDTRVLPSADFAIFSLPKTFDMPFGAYVEGLELSDQYIWNNIGTLDVVKRSYCRSSKHFDMETDIRVARWYQYYELMQRTGMRGWINDSLHLLIATKDWTPTVIFHELKSEEQCKELQARLTEFGIESGIYYPKNVVYLPIHQSLTEENVEYMFAVVAGFFNLCHNYQKQ